jgi:Enolase, N-terminal domain
MVPMNDSDTPQLAVGGQRRKMRACDADRDPVVEFLSLAYSEGRLSKDEEWMMALYDMADLSALEILDSRGRPTLAVTVRLADGTTARAGVPSGASTGSRHVRDGQRPRLLAPALDEVLEAVHDPQDVPSAVPGLDRGRGNDRVHPRSRAAAAQDSQLHAPQPARVAEDRVGRSAARSFMPPRDGARRA